MMGCTGNQSKVDTEHTEHTESDVPHLVTEDHKAGLIPLEDQVKLDNGEKWIANIETNEGIDNMLAMVKKEKSKETPDYVMLKERLDKEFNVLLEKCTMTGESHDQLHNYLLPLKAKIDKLDPNSSKEAIEEIENYLLTYYDYFK
ncbi:hypothetical protein [Albibacterium sp.]|uniref:hypothetical protein n=1 Tax=Albibacterium sp. TaxID=2952885 RepID=UPI002C43635E|nr:hypothetical protein [Albibacterium sp.]HUH19400.1 hypothetical protein [Albibacterium sp.]